MPSLSKASARIDALTRSHPLVDGNKRMAMIVGMAVLNAARRRLSATAMAVAEHRLLLEDRVAWIAGHATALA